jgi:hypothetical protein
MLFQKLSEPDRTRTQLAYMAQYLPWQDLNEGAAALVVWRKLKMMHKGILVNSLSVDKDKLIPLDTAQEFQILWKHNNIPTEMEWERKSDMYIISVDLRIIKDIGPIALLSF